ncbi:hypothetical protein B296_00038172 [Ensete ventricosum]|uniref:Uncharacterized protein n=1 Tax=Ensete ventricosum TaxID=4639 RepID=A0A426ZXC1_ENSVE|nr:hypothetical protein B296_00038172 [Ensete ventricosum]
MIPLLPLQKFMPLTSVQGKLRASTPCSIFYVESLPIAPPLDLVMHPLMHYLIRDHATTPCRSLSPRSFAKLLS